MFYIHLRFGEIDRTIDSYQIILFITFFIQNDFSNMLAKSDGWNLEYYIYWLTECLI